MSLTSGYSVLSNAIKNIVLASPLVNASEVYQYEKNRFQGYPAVTITMKSGQNVFADTARNMRSFIFSVKVYQERLDIPGGEAEAENAVRNVVDNLIGLLEQDTTQLGGTLSGKGFMKPINSAALYVQAPDVNVRLVEFDVECVVIE